MKTLSAVLCFCNTGTGLAEQYEFNHVRLVFPSLDRIIDKGKKQLDAVTIARL